MNWQQTKKFDWFSFVKGKDFIEPESQMNQEIQHLQHGRTIRSCDMMEDY